MDKAEKAFELIWQKYHERYGADEKMEDGEEFVSVFNDAVVIIALEKKELKIEILAGEPFIFDMNLNLLESQREKEVSIDEVCEDDHISLHLKNGEVMTGLFQFFDGEEICLKSLDETSKVNLAWNIQWVEKITINN